jgi:ABC-type lipoprotein release transport system permease subunit
MKELVKLAWRNLWRNRRRTYITAASIFFAIWFATVMRSFQLGTYDHMIQLLIESYSGYLQVQQADYFDDPSIDNAFRPSAACMQKIRNTPNVKVAVPRIESFALASTGTLSKGVVVTGISPREERSMSNPANKLVRYRITPRVLQQMKGVQGWSAQQQSLLSSAVNTSYTSDALLMRELGVDDSLLPAFKTLLRFASLPSRYLSETDEGVLLSDRLSRYLNLNIGDSVVLMGQGYHGVSAARVFPIRGIVKIPAVELDNKLIYMTLPQASRFYGMDGMITSVCVNLYDKTALQKTQRNLETVLTKQHLRVHRWEEIIPVLKQQIQGSSQKGLVFIWILYVIIFFGIYGTVQMMLSERRREFGVLVAIGMSPRKLAGVVGLEMGFLGLIGIGCGMLAAVPFIVYGYYYPLHIGGEVGQMYMDYGFDPVMPMAWFGGYFLRQGLTVFLMVVVATLLPMKHLLRINVIQSIHGQ